MRQKKREHRAKKNEISYCRIDGIKVHVGYAIFYVLSFLQKMPHLILSILYRIWRNFQYQETLQNFDLSNTWILVLEILTIIHTSNSTIK